MYPAFDERGLWPSTNPNRNRGSGISIPRQVITRSGNGLYSNNDGFLNYALTQAKANNLWVFIESWNDWLEQTQIEPGFSFNNFIEHGDYFSSLRVVGNFKGINNINFSFPSSSIVDPTLVKYGRNNQFTNKKVYLKGNWVFSSNNSGTINEYCKQGIYYIDDQISYQNLSYNNPTKYKSNLTRINLNANQLSNDFKIDVTKYLDTGDLIWAIDLNNNFSNYNLYITNLKLEWYGKDINLTTSENINKINWHDNSGNITPVLTNNVTINNQVLNNIYKITPRTNNKPFIHAGINLFRFSSQISNN